MKKKNIIYYVQRLSFSSSNFVFFFRPLQDIRHSKRPIRRIHLFSACPFTAPASSFRVHKLIRLSRAEGRRVHQELGERRVRHGKAAAALDQQPGPAQTQHGRHRADRVRREVQHGHRAREEGAAVRPVGVPARRQGVRGPGATVPAGRPGHQRDARPVHADRARQDADSRRLLERRAEESGHHQGRSLFYVHTRGPSSREPYVLRRSRCRLWL